MSTIVQMPVRVNPPPADIGEIISPGCAFFEIATPANGARMTMSSRVGLDAAATWRSATAICCCEYAIRALSDVDLGLRRVDFGPADDLLLHQLVAGGCIACSPRAAAPRPRQQPCAPCSAAPRDSASAARICESSSRARTWPFVTALPSSTNTSMTLPVTFDETVARRRAVT